MKTGGMSFFFRFATPKTILVVLTREGATSVECLALETNCSCLGLALQAGLRPFGEWREENVR